MGYLVLFSLIGIGLYILYRKFFKKCLFNAVTLITGGVKCGKSALTVTLALRSFRRNVRWWKIRKFFCKLLRREVPEKPVLYSNIPLRKVDYTPLTRSLLLRKKRFAYKSVVILDEASLVADSQLIKDKRLNIDLTLFFKLFGHETHGGQIFVCSHSLSDLHYSVKRVTSSYIWVSSLRKLPFFSIAYVREERYSDDGGVVNTYDKDVQSELVRIPFLNARFKNYDCYCYSELTDDLPVFVKNTYTKNWADLKTCNIVSFRPEFADVKQFTTLEVKDKDAKT